MCGRYTVSRPKSVLRDLLGRASDTEYRSRFNVAPGQVVPIIVRGHTLTNQIKECHGALNLTLHEAKRAPAAPSMHEPKPSPKKNNVPRQFPLATVHSTSR